MEIKLYNTLTKTKETFKPITPGEVSMYHCGPTVYDTQHIGNYRTFIMNDLVRRMFEYNSYKVIQAMNITDVDDKTIRRSREQGISLDTLTRKYEALFVTDSASLNILTPQYVIRATEYIPAMIELIQTLVNKGVAYVATDGVYMNITKVPNYGALAHITTSSTSRERITNDEYNKTNPHDFALWKFKTTDDGDVAWEAPFGTGRPGWHIECSVMAMKVLGETFDIHTGGTDLVFPHHTNEIAQSESATGKPFAHYWIHGAFMNVEQEKMAKSRGNFIKLETLREHAISPLAYRYWLLTAHYRSPINFTYVAVEAAQKALIRLLTHVSNYPDGGTIVQTYTDRFNAFVVDDLDIPQALALVWELIKDATILPQDKKATILDFDRVLGLDMSALPPIDTATLLAQDIPIEITVLAEARVQARAHKEWAKADALRIEIQERGFDVVDTDDSFSIVVR
jgi:cysteinyl-tRNA synthetase